MCYTFIVLVCLFFFFFVKKNIFSSLVLCFLVPVRRPPRPCRSMHFADASRTAQKLARTTGPETHLPRTIMRPRDEEMSYLG